MDIYLEAEYQDGYKHNQRDLRDVSLYMPGKSVGYDIRTHQPAADHGPLVKVTLYHPGGEHTLNWAALPEGAKFIFFKHIERRFNAEQMWLEEPRIVGIDFGYEYKGEDGKTHKHVENI